MEMLETLSQINPEERDSIIHILLEHKQHISVQNAINILMAEHSCTMLKTQSTLPEDFKNSLENVTTTPLPFSLQP